MPKKTKNKGPRVLHGINQVWFERRVERARRRDVIAKMSRRMNR